MAKRYKFSQDAEEIQGLLNKIDGLQVNQSCGCGTNCELENVELNDVVYSVITRAVDNLLNYYTKSETFTRSEIDSKISAIHQFSIKQVDVLPRPAAETAYTLYLVPSSEQRTDNITDEFITVYRNGSYVWEQVGTSPVDLSHYVTDSQLNSVLSGYVTSQAFSSAVTNLSNRIDGLHEVKYTMQNLTDGQKSRARSNIGAGTYSKPSSGIPASDLANGVIPDVSQFITKTVNDLANYYTKSQTYTKQEVRALIGGLVGFTYVLAPSLPEPTIDTMWNMYLIPSEEPKEANAKDEFITIDNGSSANPRYAWEQVGSTAIDLSGYVTTEALNDALANYVTSDALSTALAGLNDVKYTAQSLTDLQKAQARTNIGATAPEVFWAVYGTTTAQEVRDAVAAGKVCLCLYNGRTYYFSGDLVGSASYNFLWFICMQNDQTWYARVRTDTNQWSSNYTNLERSSNKSQSVETDKDSTAKYPSTKAVADAIEAGKQVFWAVYGETTFEEVTNAIASGKEIAVAGNNTIVLFSGKVGDNYYFASPNGTQSFRYYILNPQDAWSGGTVTLEQSTRKVSTIVGHEAETDKYPNTKAVADALAPKYEKPQTGIPANDLADGVIPDISGKADKVQSATAGHLAGLNAGGNPTDTGLVPLDIPLFPNMDGLTPVQTIEYDLTKNEWCKLFERINPEGTVASDVTEVIACRVTVTGDNMAEPQVIDIVVMGPGRLNRHFFAVFRALTPDISAANKFGIYQLRNSCPKALGSGYGWVVDFNPSYAVRHIKVEVFKTASSVEFFSEHTKSNVSSTYHTVAGAIVVDGTKLFNNLENNVNGSCTSATFITGYLMPLFSTVIQTGEAIITNQICFIGADGKAYPVSNTVQAINPDAFVFVAGTGFAINKDISTAYLRTITSFSLSATTNPNVTIPQFVKGDQLFLRCHIANGAVYSDAVITKAVSPGYTWIALGYAASATSLALSTHGKEFYTLDANGKLTHVNGREIAVPASGVQDVTLGGTSVVSGGVAVLPAYPTVPTISTDIETDKASNTKTASPKAVYDEVHPAVATTQPAGGMLPNVFYNLGTLSGNTTFSFASASDANIKNEWMFQFITPATAPTITWPADITSWMGGVAPVIKENKTYQVSVVNGLGIIAEF